MPHCQSTGFVPCVLLFQGEFCGFHCVEPPGSLPLWRCDVSLWARGFPPSRSTQSYYCVGGSELCCFVRLKFPTTFRAAITPRDHSESSHSSSGPAPKKSIVSFSALYNSRIQHDPRLQSSHGSCINCLNSLFHPPL